MEELTGQIFEIQRFSIHDGPGIRTTVFLKGCPLHCLWCHNPEGISKEKVLSYLPDKCIGCGYCASVCPNQAHRIEDGKHYFDRTVCQVCGLCARECYAGALELVGREETVQEVIKEVLRDVPFYETSGGGMTLSGGEPMLQPEFSLALLKAAKEAGLHCAIETCGYMKPEHYQLAATFVDLFLYDIKDTNDAKHREFTGVSNQRIISNLKMLHDMGAAILIRLPVIPGYNDRPDHFQGVVELTRSLPNLRGVEIMPYHNLGNSKVDRLGLDPKSRAQSHSPENAILKSWIEWFEAQGVTIINPKPVTP